jgi:hypothetical protein
MIAVMTLPALAPGSRYQIFAMPDVRKASANWVNSAYVVDKKENQFWTCAAPYDFSSQELNNGDCANPSSSIGRPLVSEKYTTSAVVGSTPYGAFLPVLWFIEPATGNVESCALRATGMCVHLKLP